MCHFRNHALGHSRWEMTLWRKNWRNLLHRHRAQDTRTQSRFKGATQSEWLKKRCAHTTHSAQAHRGVSQTRKKAAATKWKHTNVRLIRKTIFFLRRTTPTFVWLFPRFSSYRVANNKRKIGEVLGKIEKLKKCQKMQTHTENVFSIYFYHSFLMSPCEYEFYHKIILLLLVL